MFHNFFPTTILMFILSLYHYINYISPLLTHHLPTQSSSHQPYFCSPLYQTLSHFSSLGPEHTGHFVQPHVAAYCGGDIYSRRKPLFSSFGEHTAVCGSSVRQAVARPRHRQSVCIHNIHVAATCRPSVLGSATMRGHMWLNKVASVLGPLLPKLVHVLTLYHLNSFFRRFL